MKSKIYIFMVSCLLVVATLSLLVSANNKTEKSALRTYEQQSIDTTTNFFTRKEDTRTVVIESKGLETLGYELVGETDYLKLYLLKRTLGIALVDKVTGYTWFSTYEKAQQLFDEDRMTENVLAEVESGVTIEYFDANSGNVNPNNKWPYTYVYNKKKASSTVKLENNGFTASIEYGSIGISFDLKVKIDGANLFVDIPYESIVEKEVEGIKVNKSYQLRSITVFPYLGSQNYEINGYSFIPDGSGALIRYTDEVSATAFIKKVYGTDYGVSAKTNLYDHIKELGSVTLPIYGVNHGYNQAAFLCQITSGAGGAELVSYPYGYSNSTFNTTFFRFNTRDMYLIELSNNSNIEMINNENYTYDYSLKYSFLNNGNANYVGMANCYREDLGLTPNENSGDISLHLDMLGVDYKSGLFGKDYVEMTTYEDALNILKDLKHLGVESINLNYIGWNKGGYFNKSAMNTSLHSSLGNKTDFKKLGNYINENNMTMEVTINPLVSSTYGLNNSTVKKLNLSSFEKEQKSSMVQTGYYVAPSELAKKINKNGKAYTKLGIYGLNIDNLSDSYSYKVGSDVFYREQMIDVLCSELDKIDGYNISTTSPNTYLLKYLTNYYSANYEASKYLYETDSVPFISILLSGYVNLYSPQINYISDYDLMNLRMIEYNIAPAFIVTKEEAKNLRFTNFEYLNSTTYEAWAELIVSTYNTVNNSLKNVNGATILNHRYVDYGVAEITYNNGIRLYVNYNLETRSVGSIQVEPGCTMVEVV